MFGIFFSTVYVILLIVVIIGLSVYSWNIAKERGYNALFAVLVSLVFPFVGYLIIVRLPDNTRKKLEYGFLKHCPHCMEVIPHNAKVCRACARAVDTTHEPSESFQRPAGSPADFADPHSFNASGSADNSLKSELKNTKRDISALVEKLKRQRKSS